MLPGNEHKRKSKDSFASESFFFFFSVVETAAGENSDLVALGLSEHRSIRGLCLARSGRTAARLSQPLVFLRPERLCILTRPYFRSCFSHFSESGGEGKKKNQFLPSHLFLFCLLCPQVVGPPGTGKTDVAVQIISNIYHNFPEQRTLIVTHSNQVTAKHTHTHRST